MVSEETTVWTVTEDRSRGRLESVVLVKATAKITAKRLTILHPSHESNYRRHVPSEELDKATGEGFNRTPTAAIDRYRNQLALRIEATRAKLADLEKAAAIAADVRDNLEKIVSNGAYYDQDA
jgi:hypothetical protein